MPATPRAVEAARMAPVATDGTWGRDVSRARDGVMPNRVRPRCDTHGMTADTEPRLASEPVPASRPTPTTPQPDFFIVGAPKTGTTALWRYLSGHPEVYMPIVKEPHHFGSDVRSALTLERRDAYLGLFAGAGDARAIGEASVWYLRSKDAAAEIAAFEPRARIIAMVREPVSQIRSLHNHHVARGIEDITDLGRAIDAGTQRFRGRMTGEPTIPEFLDYRRVPLYAEQLARYYAVFPPEQIHVIVQEEFSADTASVFGDVLRFLGVDDAYQPDFIRYGESIRSRNRGVSRWLNAPPAPLRRAARRFIPPLVRKRIHQLVRKPLLRATTVRNESLPIDPALERRLRDEFAPEVHRLAEMLGRPDLPALWGYEPVSP